MKSNILIKLVIVFAVVSATTCAQPLHAAGGAHLIVQRSANFGQDLVVHLSIDGRVVSNIAKAHRYEGNLSPGRHTLTVLPSPNPQQFAPTSRTVTLHSGTNIYSVNWSSTKLVIIPTRDNIPAAPAPPAIR